MKKEKIADRINVEAIRFVTQTRVHNQAFVVNFAKSTNCLTFNKKTVKLLEIANWSNVIVGYEAKADVIVLKNVDAQEYGAVGVKEGKAYNKTTKEKYDTGGKVVHIGHLLATNGIITAKQYRPERNGDMMLLEPVR